MPDIHKDFLASHFLDDLTARCSGCKTSEVTAAMILALGEMAVQLCSCLSVDVDRDSCSLLHAATHATIMGLQVQPCSTLYVHQENMTVTSQLEELLHLLCLAKQRQKVEKCPE